MVDGQRKGLVASGVHRNPCLHRMEEPIASTGIDASKLGSWPLLYTILHQHVASLWRRNLLYRWLLDFGYWYIVKHVSLDGMVMHYYITHATKHLRGLANPTGYQRITPTEKQGLIAQKEWKIRLMLKQRYALWKLYFLLTRDSRYELQLAGPHVRTRLADSDVQENKSENSSLQAVYLSNGSGFAPNTKHQITHNTNKTNMGRSYWPRNSHQLDVWKSN